MKVFKNTKIKNKGKTSMINDSGSVYYKVLWNKGSTENETSFVYIEIIYDTVTP